MRTCVSASVSLSRGMERRCLSVCHGAWSDAVCLSVAGHERRCLSAKGHGAALSVCQGTWTALSVCLLTLYTAGPRAAAFDKNILSKVEM
ncbi:hypothetical protein AVEN_115655-1 [Araneus ventricosus]|uniref:Uncharacterized protein n=1 Tax=Araneus ventricosus TaxID=182803 RepID=A0A4Y2HNA5_ARAVE|nr:hypothetical protein AVEN_115655-1 [Araneus ventricosus]